MSPTTPLPARKPQAVTHIDFHDPHTPIRAGAASGSGSGSVPQPRPNFERSPELQARSAGQENKSPNPNPRLSPIITHQAQPPLNIPGIASPSHPQFAELLTPLKLRRRRNDKANLDQQHPHVVPVQVAGPSRLGYYTLEGDLFRGATRDPTVPYHQLLEEDAISLGSGSTSSSSSNWSANLDRARAVIERFGEALGVRRGSNSSGSSSSGSSSESDTSDGRSQASRRQKRRRKRRGSHNLARTMSMLSRQTTVESHAPKRQHLPKRREFILLVPPKEKEVDIGVRSSAASSEKESSTLNDGSPPLGPKSYPPDRVVVTPSLPVVLEQIRSLRLANGYLPTDFTPPQTPGVTSNVPVRRGGSAPGRTRAPKGAPSFINPPLASRPLASRTQSRLHALRGDLAGTSSSGGGNTGEPIRPKSVSDLLGLARPNSTGSLTSLRADYHPPSRLGTPTLQKDGFDLRSHKGKASETWWLDVSCPGWEDLRDIGELLGLHPLTLEDVLQQDPREKLDHFDKLGYYFLVVRALDESYFKYTPGSANSSGAALVEAPQRKAALSTNSTPGTESIEMQETVNREHEKKEGRRRGWGMGRASGKNATKSGEKVEIVEDNPGKEGLEGVGVGAVNIYLVVFADGIVSFHFEDISKHTRRVLDRALNFPNPEHGSDWIAHGLIDSIVDAFFPLIRYVDGEVDDIDSLTIDPTTDPKKTTAILESEPIPSPNTSWNEFEVDEKSLSKHEKPSLLPTMWRQAQDLKKARVPLRKRIRGMLGIPKTHLGLRARMHVPKPLIYLRLFFLPTSSAMRRKHEQVSDAVFDRSTMLKRITDMRRLVTGLTRLLGAKGAVIARLRKRARDEGVTMEAYIGDVEDHILLLQTSLYHYEYILSHCQPAYLSHLNVSFSFARGGTDKAILALSTVTISILPMQLITGLFSMNVRRPQNGDPTRDDHRESDGSMAPFNYFAAIVVGIFLVACCMVAIIRYWRWLARKKWSRLRGADIPDFWEGFWGWR
ncbi:hypothetical protein I317_03143 [Kwoniella heveanensis CBS 569]|nr:hypothetical protein I317_03143 [Kwoniella heveanensis CBS 569]